MTGVFGRRNTFAQEGPKKVGSGTIQQNQPILRASFAQTSVKTDSDPVNRTLGYLTNKKSITSGTVSDHYLKGPSGRPGGKTYYAEKVSKTASRRQSTSVQKSAAAMSTSNVPMNTFKLSERPVVQQ